MRSANHDLEGPVSAQGEEAIRSLGSGAPLPAAERAFFEPRLGVDLEAVRVHSGERAASAAESVSARAFTLGSDVVFGQGEFRPGSAEGRRLIAHELAHTVQQGAVQQRGAELSKDVDPGPEPGRVAPEARAERIQRQPLGAAAVGPEGAEEEGIDFEALKREQHPLRRAPVVDLLDKGKAEGVGQARQYVASEADQAKGLEPIDLATLHQADVLVAAAEADAQLFAQEKEQAKADLKSARQALRQNRRQAFGAGLRRQRERRLEIKGQRGSLKDEVARLKALNKNLAGQEEMRGHHVEWLSSILPAGEGSFGFTQPIPGHPKREKDEKTGAFSQPSMREPTDRELALVGITDQPVGDLHSHPFTGDPRQVPGVPSQTGLGPSPTDRRTAGKNPDHRQSVLNPRGEVIHIGTGGQKDRTLRPGLTGGEAAAAKEPAAMAEAKQRLGLPSFEALVQQQLRVLKAVDRQAVVGMQRLKGS
ncbi:MAG: DUF4157 domain-containing protein [Acidobacteriota bacterium]